LSELLGSKPKPLSYHGSLLIVHITATMLVFEL
jgi:hypothetical protein